MSSGPPSSERVITSATCLGCGCACDDITLVVLGDREARIAEALNACTMGASWFGDGAVPSAARVAGKDTDVASALEAATALLIDASRPLVYLAPDISCETQREGVAIADALRAALDSVTSSGAMASVLAAQERGRASATLGHVRNFADVLVFWGVDPAHEYPRYWTRYAPEPEGLRTPYGRRSRRVISVDLEHAQGPADADVRVELPAAEEVATLTALTALISGAGRTHASSAAPWARAQEIAPALLAGRYVTVVADAELDPDVSHRDPARPAALIALTQALNGPTRCALSLLRAGGNRSGADAVVTWQTGYPAAVDFSRGYPQYRPHDAAIPRLARREVDALLVLGSAAHLPRELLSAAAHVRCAVIGPRATESPLAGAEAVIDTGVAGIHEGGTAVRMDDVPLPLRRSIEGPPSAADLARQLRERVTRR